MRRTMLLALVSLCLSLMLNLLLARPKLSSATAPTTIACTDVWCCVFDWGCFFNLFQPYTHQWKCCEVGPDNSCVGCYEVDGIPCCEPYK